MIFGGVVISVLFHIAQSATAAVTRSHAKRGLAIAVMALFGLFAPGARADEPAAPASPEDSALHGQITLIDQYHPAFRSPYRGANSLDPGSRGNETVNATLYGGVRLWDGGEAYADGEMDQGFGLSNTLGVAAFTNGEGSKVGSATPYLRLHRLFLRQSFDLGGDQQALSSAPNQLAGSLSADHLILTAGKFSAVDIFDGNQYAHDPTHDFLNWAVIDEGAYDYAADAWGYSYGAVAEWQQGVWTVRAGLFDMSRRPNGTALVRGFGQYQLDAELERRFQLSGKDGSLKVLGWMDRARLGAYNDAVALAAVTHQPADTVLVEKPHSRPGGSINLEQALGGDLGFFFRAGLADGSQESYEFTDMDRSVSTGLSLKGTGWGRGDDTVGLALEDGAISRSGQSYLAAGGLGILIGDGRLTRYDDERVVEAFYNAALWTGINAGFDYQFIANPAYNADRGPVSVLGIRLHGEF
jgi:high affinity Mn2+ porin